MSRQPLRLRAERRVVGDFLDRDATCAADAIVYDAGKGARLRAFDGLKGRDVLRPAGADRWYLDERRWGSLRAGRRKRAAGLIAVGAALAAFVVTR